ncbi:MAG: glyS [Ramlibacter sp.]|nr:glyS [Ramlibacter sp.]
MSTQNLLVELFVEELPPKALKKLGEAFAGALLEQLKSQGLATAGSSLTAYASPRRLAAHITGVSARAADKAVSQKLMPVSVGLDASGNPTPALLKKLQALGADASAAAGLKRAIDGKAEALFYDSTARGATLAEGLQKALDEAIARLPIPKVMTYQLADGWSDVKFVRPAHSLVALHGAQVIPVQALGLQSGNTTRGHRFEASVDPVRLPDADSYAAALEQDGAVIASFEARRAEIVRQLAQAAAKVGGGARPIEDAALLDEVTGLVERPNVLTCQFESEFLQVPQECLILTMKANQKYFPLLDAQGKLTNRFLVVSNIRPDDASAVIQGNERVVRPRLADAKFFSDQDRKKTLESRVPQLAKVVYHNKLGTQGERTERVRALARVIGAQLGSDALAGRADQAAMLTKADLVTDMVGEFPELQGTMGRYYALNDKLPGDVADAIEDHYKPRFAGDELPRGDAGVVVALADKLETLAGLFSIGQLPTGDRDPFALRRHALGVVRMLMEKDLPLSLDTLIAQALALFPGAAANTASLLSAFIADRLSGLLREQGYSAQEVDAVIALGPQRLGDIPKRLAAVRAFAALPEAPALAAANKRISNILKKADKADAHVSDALLREPAEQALHAAMKDIAPRAAAQFDAGDYTASLQTLAALRAPVDAFFDGVMVNAEEPDLRLNRLGLLATLHQAMNRVADLSRLAV